MIEKKNWELESSILRFKTVNYLGILRPVIKMFQFSLTLKDIFNRPTEALVQQIQKAENTGNMPFGYSPGLFYLYTFFVFFLQKRGGRIAVRSGHGYINKGSRSHVNQNEIDKMKTIYTERVPKTPQGPAKYKVKYNDADPLCRLLITGDGDVHNPVSGQVSVKAEDELFKYVVARCYARMQIVLFLKSKRLPTKKISYEETVVCIVMPLQLKHPALLENMLKTIDAIRPLPLST